MSSGARSGKVVLVVDDNKDVRILLRKVLELEGYGVEEAENGRQALQLLTERDGKGIDLVLLDAMMPQVNGWETLKAIREDESLAHLPVVLCTARNIDPERSPGWSKADGAVHKPFRRAEVLKAVRTALERSGS
jgi:CheY-like chemotaxis protein